MAEDRADSGADALMLAAIWCAVLVPAGLGVMQLLFRRIGGGLRGAIALIGTALTLALVVWLWARQSVVVTPGGVSPDMLAPFFRVDGVGLLLAALFGTIWLLVVIYSLGYMRGREHQDDYYGCLLLMLGAMMGFCFSWNLIALYIFWELAGVCTWRLVAHRRTDLEIATANRTLLITFSGSVLMLVGFAMVFVDGRSFDMSSLAGPVSPWAAVFILAGMVTKSASLPLYIWLPDAHTAAPSPVSALLSGIVAKIGLIAYLRVFIQSQVLLPAWWTWLVGGLGVGGALVAAGVALRENDIKRILGFSTVSQLGYVFLGFAVVSGLGAVAGVIYLVAHALAKSGLFLAMGLVEHATGKRDLRELGGLMRGMPFTAAAVALLMLSIIGIPPLLGFFGKFYVVVAAIRVNLVLAVGAIAAAILTLLYMLRLYRVFIGAPRAGATGYESWAMTTPVVVLAALTTGLGLGFPVFVRLVERGLGL
jgi:formate hydrogenlyase subunit 3/multisubunit Na+/H+ antiporter MnhD subunit